MCTVPLKKDVCLQHDQGLHQHYGEIKSKAVPIVHLGTTVSADKMFMGMTGVQVINYKESLTIPTRPARWQRANKGP